MALPSGGDKEGGMMCPRHGPHGLATDEGCAVRYASFWQRLLGLIVDFAIVHLPLLVVQLYIEARSRLLAIALYFPLHLLPYAYEVYFHAKRGQTIGKTIARAKVVTHDGFPIGWRIAAVRSSVWIALVLAFSHARIVGLWRMPDIGYTDLTWVERSRALARLSPTPPLLAMMSEWWYWGEVIVMLLNRERRALHDFIAGTIVVDTRKRKTERKKVKVRLLGGVRATLDPSAADDPNGEATD